MKNYKELDIFYDEQGDFLEISFGLPPETEYTEDIESGVFITKDAKTHEIKSIGILGFKAKAKEAILKRILRQFDMSIPLDISISKSYNLD